jgi:peroxiredoxin
VSILLAAWAGITSEVLMHAGASLSVIGVRLRRYAVRVLEGVVKP